MSNVTPSERSRTHGRKYRDVLIGRENVQVSWMMLSVLISLGTFEWPLDGLDVRRQTGEVPDLDKLRTDGLRSCQWYSCMILQANDRLDLENKKIKNGLFDIRMDL